MLGEASQAGGGGHAAGDTADDDVGTRGFGHIPIYTPRGITEARVGNQNSSLPVIT
ncbi:hypothetical protein GCM10027418_25120 [Mariniluteicoccus endophyticus]